MTPPASPGSGRGPVLIVIDSGATPGESLRSAIGSMLSPAERLIVDDDAMEAGTVTTDELLAWPNAERAHIRLIVGSCAYGIDERWHRPARYVGIVREPLARVGELYRRHLALAARMGRAVPTLREYVFEQRHLSADNGQTRLLAGRQHVGFGHCDEALYDAAMDNIDRHFDALPLAARPAAAIESIAKLLSADAAATASGVEADADMSEPGLEASADELAAVEELNRYDRRLHDDARARLDALAASVADPA